MKTIRRTDIEAETYELTKIRFRKRVATELQCGECGTNTPHIPLDDAVTLPPLHARRIIGWEEDGKIHSRHGSDGKLMLCANSLSAWATEQTRKMTSRRRLEEES